MERERSERKGLEGGRERPVRHCVGLPLPEWGASTPAVIGDALFVTSHAGRDLLLVRVDAKTGSVAWVRKVAEGEAARMELRLKSVEERRGQKFHRDHKSRQPIACDRRRARHRAFRRGDIGILPARR
jgi:hypothetical protein